MQGQCINPLTIIISEEEKNDGLGFFIFLNNDISFLEEDPSNWPTNQSYIEQFHDRLTKNDKIKPIQYR